MITINTSNIGEPTLLFKILTSPVRVNDSAAGLVLPESMYIDANVCVDLEDVPFNGLQYNAYYICNYIQFSVRTKLIQSSIACVRSLLEEVTIPSMNVCSEMLTKWETRFLGRLSASGTAAQALGLVGCV